MEHFPDALRNITQYITYITIATSKLTTIPTDVFDLFENLISLTVQADIRNITRSHLENAIKLQTLKLGLTNHLSQLESFLLANLTSLEYIDLAYNDITEIGEKVFNNLPKLQFLYLEGNFISTLKNETFVGADNLQVLDLSRNEVFLIESNAFSGLSKLRTLTLNRNRIKIIQGSLFRGLRSLRRLDVSINEIVILENSIFEGLDQITMVELGFNNLTTLAHSTFKGATSLENLYLSFNKFSIIGSTFLGLLNLKLLDLSYNNIGEINAAAFSDATKLEQIELRSTGLTQVPIDLLRQQTELQLLDLSYNNLSLTDKDFEAFRPLKKLQFLKLENTSLMGLTDELKDILPELKYVNIAENVMDCESVHILINFFINHSIDYDFGDRVDVGCTLLPYESLALQAYDLSHSVFIPVEEIPNYKDPYPKRTDWFEPRPGQNPFDSQLFSPGEGGDGIELDKPSLIGAAITNNTGITINDTQFQVELQAHSLLLMSLIESIKNGVINETNSLFQKQNVSMNTAIFPPANPRMGAFSEKQLPNSAANNSNFRKHDLFGFPMTSNPGRPINGSQIQRELNIQSSTILFLAQVIASGLISDGNAKYNENSTFFVKNTSSTLSDLQQNISSQLPHSKVYLDDQPILRDAALLNNTKIKVNDTQLKKELQIHSTFLHSLVQLIRGDPKEEVVDKISVENNSINIENFFINVKPTTYRPAYKKFDKLKEVESIAPTTYRTPYKHINKNSKNHLIPEIRRSPSRTRINKVNISNTSIAELIVTSIPTTYRPSIIYKNATTSYTPTKSNPLEPSFRSNTEQIVITYSRNQPDSLTMGQHIFSVNEQIHSTTKRNSPRKDIKYSPNSKQNKNYLNASKSNISTQTNSMDGNKMAPNLAAVNPNHYYNLSSDVNGFLATVETTSRQFAPNQTHILFQQRQVISGQIYVDKKVANQTIEKSLQGRTANRGAIKHRPLASSSSTNTEKPIRTSVQNSKQFQNRGKIKFHVQFN